MLFGQVGSFYEGVAARRSEVDLCRFHLALGLPLKLVRAHKHDADRSCQACI